MTSALSAPGRPGIASGCRVLFMASELRVILDSFRESLPRRLVAFAPMGAERGRRQSPGLVRLAVYLRAALNLCDRETGTGFLDLGERYGAGASFPAGHLPCIRSTG